MISKIFKVIIDSYSILSNAKIGNKRKVALNRVTDVLFKHAKRNSFMCANNPLRSFSNKLFFSGFMHIYPKYTVVSPFSIVNCLRTKVLEP